MNNEIRKFIDIIKNTKATDKRKYVGAKNLHEAFKLNGFSINKNNDLNAKTIYFENDTQLMKLLVLNLKTKVVL